MQLHLVKTFFQLNRIVIENKGKLGQDVYRLSEIDWEGENCLYMTDGEK